PLALVANLTDPFIVMNGDLLTTLDFPRMLSFHLSEKADLTVGIFPREVRIDFGVILFDEAGEFQGYSEKPTYRYEVSMGVNIIGLSAMEHILAGQRLDMPELVLKTHGSGKKVKCYRQPCRWLDIGRMEDYSQAQEEFAKNEMAFLQLQQ